MTNIFAVETNLNRSSILSSDSIEENLLNYK